MLSANKKIRIQHTHIEKVMMVVSLYANLLPSIQITGKWIFYFVGFKLSLLFIYFLILQIYRKLLRTASYVSHKLRES